MRTGTWGTWLAGGLVALAGIGSAQAQIQTLPAAPRPVVMTTDNGPPSLPPSAVPAPAPPPPPNGAAPKPLPTAMPIDAPMHNGHGESHALDEHNGGSECDCGGLVFWGDYLLLHAHREALDFAVQGPFNVGAPSGNVANLDWQTQSGFRVGGGWMIPGSGVMLGISYTYFHSHDNETLNVQPGGQLFATLTRSLSIDDVTSAFGTTSIDYDVIDLLASKRFSPAECVDITVVGGGRIAWIDQKLDAVYNGGSLNAVNDHVSSPSYFSGAGLTAGMETMWMLMRGHGNQGLGIYTSIRGSIVSGEFHRNVTETNNNGSVVIVEVDDRSHGLVPVLELAGGLSFERENYFIRVGYEVTNWFNFIDSPDFATGGNIGKVNRRTADLSLEGLQVRAGVKF
jgi:hypothetical protein